LFIFNGLYILKRTGVPPGAHGEAGVKSFACGEKDPPQLALPLATTLACFRSR
jgi:hypothetical protein